MLDPVLFVSLLCRILVLKLRHQAGDTLLIVIYESLVIEIANCLLLSQTVDLLVERRDDQVFLL